MEENKTHQNGEQQQPTKTVKHHVCSCHWNSSFVGGNLEWSLACLKVRDKDILTREHTHESSHKVSGNHFLQNSRTLSQTLSSYRLLHSFSLRLCSQAVITKLLQPCWCRDGKGNHCFLRGRLRKRVTTCCGRMSSEKWRNEKWKVFTRAVTNTAPLIELDSRVGRNNLTAF